EGDQTLEDYGDFEEGTRSHSFGVLFETVLPIVMRVQLALFQEPEHFRSVDRADDRPQPHGACVRLRHHDSQSAGDYADHVVTFRPAVQYPVTDLFDYSNAVVRINDFVANLIVHSFGCPPRRVTRV